MNGMNGSIERGGEGMDNGARAHNRARHGGFFGEWIFQAALAVAVIAATVNGVLEIGGGTIV